MIIEEEPMRLRFSEGNIAVITMGRGRAIFPGSENTAWGKSGQVNVGGPGCSCRSASIGEQV